MQALTGLPQRQAMDLRIVWYDSRRLFSLLYNQDNRYNNNKQLIHFNRRYHYSTDNIGIPRSVLIFTNLLPIASKL